MKKFSVLTLISALACATETGFSATDMPALDGTWISTSCELRPQAGPDGVNPWHLTRSVIFNGDRIDAHFTTFADANCSTPLVELKFGGEVRVLGASDVVSGAKNVDLIVNDYLTITPRRDGFSDFLNSAQPGACGNERWQTGVEQNIYKTGCSVMGVAADTPSNEFEVLYVASGLLYFGARPVNGKPLDTPQSRPTALQVPLQLAGGGMTRQVGAADVRVPTHVEIVNFTQADGADPAEVRAFFEDITIRMNQNDTLLYRTVAQGEDGNWLCINYWLSHEAMKELNAQAQSWTELTSEINKVVKPGSFRLSSYALNR